MLLATYIFFYVLQHIKIHVERKSNWLTLFVQAVAVEWISGAGCCNEHLPATR